MVCFECGEWIEDGQDCSTIVLNGMCYPSCTVCTDLAYREMNLSLLREEW